MGSGGKTENSVHRGWTMAGWIVAFCVLLALIAFGFSGPIKNWVKQEAIATLDARFASQVTMSEFEISIYPQIRLSGRGLVLRVNGHPHSPPLITVAHFFAETSLIELIRRPAHIHRISLEGLYIRIPPRQEQPVSGSREPVKKLRKPLPVIVDLMIVKIARLELLSSNTLKPPRIFVISRVVMRQTGLGRPTAYHAWLRNPKPPGEIDCSGNFGPWNAHAPRETPLTGNYTFTQADLSVFRGIAGILSSEGNFRGTLENIGVQGTTSTPDFSVRLSGNVVNLATDFHSVVDGTTGNTMLQPVVAHFLQTTLTARGGVLKVTGRKGRVLDLQVTSEHARLDDLLRFAMKGGHPPLEGIANLNTRMEIPPGPGDITDRMRLDGHLEIASVHFTQPSVDQKVQALNRKGLGKRQGDDASSVLSNLRARFVLRSAVITFSDITFTLPGAAIKLSGTYQLRKQNLDFQGTLRLKAGLSQIVKGKKSLLLIPFDPFFRRGKSGTVLPIKVTGTAESPSFQLEVGRLLRHAYD